MKKEHFTIEQALEIQAEQLERWALVLNSETFIALSNEVQRRNAAGYRSAYDVWRGQHLTAFVLNAQCKS